MNIEKYLGPIAFIAVIFLVVTMISKIVIGTNARDIAYCTSSRMTIEKESVEVARATCKKIWEN